jgi:NhaA family Na+:H+ antiporter
MGGVVLPVALFLLIAGGGAEAAGWGIPMATDIAFAVGVLAVLGNRVPGGARVFLLSIAIVDDVIAIAVIAVFYSGTPQTWWLAAACGGLLTVLGMRRSGVAAVWPYAVVGVAVWYATHESGVHATIAGVVMGLLTPARPFRGRDVLSDLERRLHPMSAFFIVPLFALANAGVERGPGSYGESPLV